MIISNLKCDLLKTAIGYDLNRSEIREIFINELNSIEPVTINVTNNFIKKIEFTNNIEDCWEWQGYCQPTGYGHFKPTHGKTLMAHIGSYMLFNNDYDPELDVCHSCDNRSCVNPFHLWQGTRQENMDDMSSKGIHPNSNLTDEQVIAIFLDPSPNLDIAEKHRICTDTVNNIKLKRHFKHLTKDLQRPITGRVYKRITDQEAIEIFLDPRPQYTIAEKYSIGQGNVSQIKNRKAHANLTEGLTVNSGKPVRL